MLRKDGGRYSAYTGGRGVGDRDIDEGFVNGRMGVRDKQFERALGVTDVATKMKQLLI